MKRTLVAIAATLGLSVGALGATSTAADARVSVHIGIGFGYGYGGYPCCGYYPYNYSYRPNYYYPHYYYSPVVCHTVIVKRVYWRYYTRYVTYVPVRSCYRVY